MKELWKLTISLFNENEPSTSTEWGWKCENDMLYLNFMGSSNFKDSTGKLAQDWKQNFDFLQTPYRGMKDKFRVHRGFLKKWKSIQEAVLAKVTPNIEHIVVTGFSQGAALALLCHEALWFNFPHLRFNVLTYAFGCPRVFSWRTPKQRFLGVTHIQYRGDMITGLPFWLFGYKHIYNTLVQMPENTKWPSWFRIGFWQHMKLFTYFKDS